MAERMRLAVDPTGFHYFDPASGERHVRSVRQTQAAGAG